MMEVVDVVCGGLAVVALVVLHNHPYFVRHRERLSRDKETRLHLYTILLLVGLLQTIAVYSVFKVVKHVWKKGSLSS